MFGITQLNNHKAVSDINLKVLIGHINDTGRQGQNDLIGALTSTLRAPNVSLISMIVHACEWSLCEEEPGL